MLVKIKKYLKIVSIKIFKILFLRIPAFFIYITIFYFVYKSLVLFKEVDDMKNAFSFYVTAIGLSVALASVTFSYYSVCNELDRKKVKSIGERFLHASLSSVIALSLYYFGLEISTAFSSNWSSKTLFAINLLFITYAGSGFAGALQELEVILFFRNKEIN